MSPVFRHGGLRLYLLKLLEDSPRHGYELITSLEDTFMGTYAPSAGTIYPRLSRLELEGLIEHDTVDGKKVYRLTQAGRDELNQRRDELNDIASDVAHTVQQIARELRDEVGASARNLKDELKAAAREARREVRAEDRVVRGKQSQLEKDIRKLWTSTLKLAWAASDEQLSKAQVIVDQLGQELLSVLSAD